MPIRKVPIRETAGVKLIQVDEVTTSGQVASTHYHLSTLRPDQPRVLADEGEAMEAFDLEVIASLADPTAQRSVSDQ